MAEGAISESVGLSPQLLAKWLDITPSRFHQLVRDGVIPKAGPGKYNPVAVVRSYIQFLRRTGANQDIKPDDLKPFERRAHYQAEMEKLDLQSKCGELIPRIEVEQEMGRVAKVLTEFLETLPDIMERDTGATPKQIMKMEAAIDQLREQIYGALTKDDGNVGNPVRQSA